MAKSPYIKTVWQDRIGITPGTALNATNFNKLEEGLVATDALAIELEGKVTALELSTPEGAEQMAIDLAAAKTAILEMQAKIEALTTAFNAHTHKIDAGEVTDVPTNIIV